MARSSQKPRKPRGPKPSAIVAEGVDWKDAITHALNKPKPKGGWPKARIYGKGKKAK